MMPEQPLQVEDFLAQAADFLEASRLKRGEGLVMKAKDDEDEDEDEDEIEGDDEDPDDEDPEDDDDSDDEDPDDEGDDEPYVKEDGKPFTAKDFQALQEALKAARKDARQAKRASKGKGSNDADEATKAAEAKYKPMLVRTEAKAAFQGAGLILPKGKESAALGKALKLLDMDDLDLNEDGEVEGLTEQVKELKGLYPELFAKKSTRRVDGAERGTGPKKNSSSASRLAGALTGSDD